MDIDNMYRKFARFKLDLSAHQTDVFNISTKVKAWKKFKKTICSQNPNFKS